SDPADGDEETGESADAGGVTIEHAFGSTTVPAGVSDVVTLGWGATEAALALDVVPVGVEAQTYAVDEDGLLPWVAEALEEVGAGPEIQPAGCEEPTYEEIAALAPEDILAPYSQIDQEQYELLSEIAPTVAYPEEPWTTPWREVATTVGTPLGLAEESEQLVAELDATLAGAAAEHPELEGVTV